MEVGGCEIETVGRMTENSLPDCCSCLLCAQTAVHSGIVVQEEDLIHLPVWPNPLNSLF
jgi:hypothetical protein